MTEDTFEVGRRVSVNIGHLILLGSIVNGPDVRGGQTRFKVRHDEGSLDGWYDESRLAVLTPEHR